MANKNAIKRRRLLHRLSPEELLKKAEQNMECAEKIDSPELRITFYERAAFMFRHAVEEFPEAEERRVEATVQKHRAMAEFLIEKYEEACRSQKEEEWSNAAAQFESLQNLMELYPVKARLLTKELRGKFRNTRDIDERREECLRMLGKKQSRKKHKGLAAVVVVAALAVGIYFFTGTAQFYRCFSYGCNLIGQTSRAAISLKKAYERSGEDGDYEAYLAYSYDQGKKLLAKGDLESAEALMSRAAEGDYENSRTVLAQIDQERIANQEIGEKISFGPSNWFVLDREDGKTLLLMSGYLMDHPLSQESEYSWETSEARAYLNSDFLEQEFYQEQLELIAVTDVKNTDNAEYATDGGSDTEDQAFLLSTEEFEKYQDKISKGKMWWLRTPGANPDSMCFVSDGIVVTYGAGPESEDIYLAPAIWVETPGAGSNGQSSPEAAE